MSYLMIYKYNCIYKHNFLLKKKSKIFLLCMNSNLQIKNLLINNIISK